jgi:hypothetical protein
MTKTKTTLLAVLGLCLTSATASAQTAAAPKVFISVNGGVHASSEDITVDATQTVYGESALIHSEQTVGGGPMFDISAGYRVWGNVSVAVGYSFFSDTSQAQMTASVPHPIFTDRRRENQLAIDELEHSQRSVHLSAMWTTPLADTMDVSVFAGPTFIKVRQDVANAITVPAGTQDAIPQTVEESKNTTAFHLGGDVTYAITPLVGVGGLVRFVIGSVDLPSAQDFSVSGFEVGGGVRLRF